jgi:hypothetical protein
MQSFVLVAGIGNLGHTAVANLRQTFARRDEKLAQAVGFLEIQSADIPATASTPNADNTRREWRRRFTAHIEAFYQKAKKAAPSAQRIEPPSGAPKAAGPDDQRLYNVWLVADLSDPFASSVIFDAASVIASACAPWRTRIIAVLSTAVFFQNPQQERRDSANVCTTLSELDRLMCAAGTGPDGFGMNYDGRIVPAKRAKPFDFCYLVSGENSSGSLANAGEMARFVSALLGESLLTALGELTVTRVEDQQVLDMHFGGSDAKTATCYSTVGMSRLFAPMDTLKEHCVLRYGSELAWKFLVAAGSAQDTQSCVKGFLQSWRCGIADMTSALSSAGKDKKIGPEIPPLATVPPEKAWSLLETMRHKVDGELRRAWTTQVQTNFEKARSLRLAAIQKSLDDLIRFGVCGVKRAEALAANVRHFVREEKTRAETRLDEIRALPKSFETAMQELQIVTQEYDDLWVGSKALFGPLKVAQMEAAANKALNEFKAKCDRIVETMAIERIMTFYDLADANAAGYARAIAQVLAMLDKIGRKFAGAKAAEPFGELFMNRPVLPPDEYDLIYEKFGVTATGAEGVGRELAFFLKSYDPLKTWAGVIEAGVESAITDYATFYFAKLDKLDVLKDILFDTRHKLAAEGLTKVTADMLKNAEPLALCQRELVPSPGKVAKLDFAGVAGPERHVERLDEKTRADVAVVESGDDKSLWFCVTLHGVPIVALPHVE